MQLRLSRQLVKRIWRAVVEFELLEAGDRVLVGVSGGKDSAFLLYALELLRRTGPLAFQLAAVHIDLGFGSDTASGLQDFCRKLGVELIVERTQIAKMALAEARQNPCARCAFFRRGAINQVAVQRGFGKVAFAHHLDDAVVTFLMSQLYSGHLKTFLPKTHLERSGLTLIRPLVYLREHEIRRGLRDIPYTPVKSGCPHEGRTQRAQTAQLVRELARANKYVFTNLAAAMRMGPHVELWPPKASKQELRQKHQRIMRPAGEENRNDEEGS